MAITRLAEHNANLTEWLGYLSASLAPSSTLNAEQKLANCYYDAQEVFYRAYDYTSNSSWLTSADYAQAAYGGYYVIPNNGQVPGYWSFSSGLTRDVLLNTDTNASNAVNLLTLNAAYHTTGDTSDDLLSRENAYALFAHVNNIRCGRAANTARIATLYANAKSHIEQWCTLLTADYFRPFMGAITARSLINYFTYYSEEQEIVTYLATLGDYTWNECRTNTSIATPDYTDRNVGNTDPPDLLPAYDLGNLILPYFGWLWWRTGQQKWLDRGDAIFDECVATYNQGGFYVSGAYLGGKSASAVNGKHVCQNFVWISDYLDWRQRTPVGEVSYVIYGTSGLFNPAILEGMKAVNLATDTLEMWLLKSTYTPSYEHSSTSSFSGHEVSGSGYSRATLTGVTWARSGGTATLNCNNPSFSASGGDMVARYWAVATLGGTLLCWGLLWDEDQDVTIPSGETHYVDCSNGLLQLAIG